MLKRLVLNVIRKIIGLILLFAFFLGIDYQKSYGAEADIRVYAVLALLFLLSYLCLFRSRKYSMAELDRMDGDRFERACADILRKRGFRSVDLTKRNGDHGVDILAKKGWKTYAIQCKRYDHPVGNKAVQEAYSGRKIYEADVAVVLTNHTFTRQAHEDAERLCVQLWDREELKKMLT